MPQFHAANKQFTFYYKKSTYTHTTHVIFSISREYANATFSRTRSKILCTVLTAGAQHYRNFRPTSYDRKPFGMLGMLMKLKSDIDARFSSEKNRRRWISRNIRDKNFRFAFAVGRTWRKYFDGPREWAAKIVKSFLHWTEGSGLFYVKSYFFSSDVLKMLIWRNNQNPYNLNCVFG